MRAKKNTCHQTKVKGNLSFSNMYNILKINIVFIWHVHLGMSALV